MSLCRRSVIVLLASVLSGCINSAMLIRVKPDGSGTLEQTLLVNTQAAKGLMAGMGRGQMPQTAGVLNEADFKRSAERMGVRTVSLTPVKDGGFEGARALYAFDDISKIRVDQEPPTGAAAARDGVEGKGSSSDATAQPRSDSRPLRFSLAKLGSSSVLSIVFDEQVASDVSAKAPPAATAPIDPAILQMIKGVFQGFRIAFDVEVEGAIVKTNADYVTGSRVTLLEIDMAALLEDEGALKELQSRVRPGITIAEIKPFLKNVKGVKVNHPTVTIEYR